MSSNVIVFPTDFSDLSSSAAAWAQRLAGFEEAEIHCLYVVEEPHVYGMLDLGPVDLPSARELTEWATERLGQFVARYAADAGRPVVATVRVGRPADEIVAYAKECQAKLIVMATHGHSGVRHILLGSTTEAVLRHASCPVLSVRAQR